MTAWRTILLAVADDAIAVVLLVIALAWLVSEGMLAPAVALAIGVAGVTVLSFIAYKTSLALAMRPKIGTGMVGRKGIALTEIKPDGMVLVEGEIWKASSLDPIEKGAAIVVTNSEGLRAVVAADKNG